MRQAAPLLLPASSCGFALNPALDVSEYWRAPSNRRGSQSLRGRDGVRGLRDSALPANDLAGTMGALGNELASDQADENAPEFRVEIEGMAVDLSSLVRDEGYRTNQ